MFQQPCHHPLLYCIHDTICLQHWQGQWLTAIVIAICCTWRLFNNFRSFTGKWAVNFSAESLLYLHRSLDLSCLPDNGALLGLICSRILLSAWASDTYTLFMKTLKMLLPCYSSAEAGMGLQARLPHNAVGDTAHCSLIHSFTGLPQRLFSQAATNTGRMSCVC